MTTDTIAITVKDIMSDMLGFEAEQIKPEDTFKELGIDSLDHAELVIDLEENFLIEITDQQAEQMTTVGNCVSMIDTILKSETPLL